MKLVYRAVINYACIVALAECLQHDLATTYVINFLWKNKIKKRMTKRSIISYLSSFSSQRRRTQRRNVYNMKRVQIEFRLNAN